MKDTNHFKFNHPNDIRIGRGRIIYESTHAAWILPGGKKTKDREKAEQVAAKIDEICRNQGF